MIGKEISHYKILEKLGEGGMGIVYKAHDTRLDRTVALKFLPSHLTSSEEDKQRFIREAKAAAALNHPHICTVYSVEEHDGQQFISMEYIDGVTLREKSEVSSQSSETPQPETAIAFALQIAEALAEAHEKGIVHRDIKPENIMIDAKNRIKVMDFGLAKLKGEMNITKAGSTVGTVAYMSPEQIQGEDVDHRSDIFSFGVVLYEMLTGQTPFRAEHEAAVMYSVVNENPLPITDYLPTATPDLIHLIERMLEKDIQDRYQSINEILGELKRIRKKSSGKIPVKTTPPEGEKSNHYSGDQKHPTTVTLTIPSFKNKFTPILVVLLVLIVSATLIFFFIKPEEHVVTERGSIAVLPFENLSPDPDDAYFTDGVHDDIITQLSKIRDLKVIARSSAMHYPVGDRNYRQIREELGVASIMEGSIRRAGDIVRVSVQLIDLETMQTLWAEIYERNLTDIFAIQRDIGREISASLKVRITDDEEAQLEKPPTENPEAYDMYLKALEYWARPGYDKDDYDIVIDFLEKAVALDPQFTSAIARLSMIHAIYYWFGHDQSPRRLELAKRYADRAYQLDPKSVITNIAMGNYYYRIRDYPRALSYLSNTIAYDLTAYVQRRMGLWDQSIENLKKVIERNPLNHDPVYQLALSYLSLREYERAEEYLKRTIAIAPDYAEAKQTLARLDILWKGDVEPLQNYISVHSDVDPSNYFMVRDFEGMLQAAGRSNRDLHTSQYYITPNSYYEGLAYKYIGDDQNAETHFRKAQIVLEGLLQENHDDYRIRARLGSVYAFLGEHEDAIREGEKTMELMPLERDSFLGVYYITNMAQIYAVIGKAEIAVELLEESLELPGDISYHLLNADPIWDPIREHRSFRRLIEKGLS